VGERRLIGKGEGALFGFFCDSAMLCLDFIVWGIVEGKGKPGRRKPFQCPLAQLSAAHRAKGIRLKRREEKKRQERERRRSQ